jgi:hypothetical protein
MLPCPPDYTLCPNTYQPGGQTVTLTANARDTLNDPLTYSWRAGAGTISGSGKTASWDLSKLGQGSYKATVTVDDGNGCITECSITVEVKDSCCKPPTPYEANCTARINGPEECVKAGDIVTLTATAEPTPDGTKVIKWLWAVDQGSIVSGQGTDTITINTAGLPGNAKVSAALRVTVQNGTVTGYCDKAFVFTICSECHPFDAYDAIKFNDEKARLDNFAIDLKSQPTAKGYIVAYTGDTYSPVSNACEDIGTKRPLNKLYGLVEAKKRSERAKEYLVTVRGIDAERLVEVDGGVREVSSVELFACPLGAPPPTPTPRSARPEPICRPEHARKTRRASRVHRKP